MWRQNTTKRSWQTWSWCIVRCQRKRQKRRWMSKRRNGVSSIRWYSCRGFTSGKTCQHTSAIRRISARSFTQQMLSNRYIASSGNWPKPKGLSWIKTVYWSYFVGLMNAQEKWTMPIQSWNLTLLLLAIYFEGDWIVWWHCRIFNVAQNSEHSLTERQLLIMISCHLTDLRWRWATDSSSTNLFTIRFFHFS